MGTPSSGVGHKYINGPQRMLEGVEKFGGRLRPAQGGADRHGPGPGFGGLGGRLFGGAGVGAVGPGPGGSFGPEAPPPRPPPSPPAPRHPPPPPRKPPRRGTPHAGRCPG